jgi:hypothetical protein
MKNRIFLIKTDEGFAGVREDKSMIMVKGNASYPQSSAQSDSLHPMSKIAKAAGLALEEFYKLL